MSIPEWNDPTFEALKHNPIVRAKVRAELEAAVGEMDDLDGMNQSQLDAADNEVARIRLAHRRIGVLLERNSALVMPGTGTPIP